MRLNPLSADNIKKWWIWGYWSSPLMYAQNALAVNEFLGKSWQKVMQHLLGNPKFVQQVKFRPSAEKIQPLCRLLITQQATPHLASKF
jgi:hypothetical protein